MVVASDGSKDATAEIVRSFVRDEANGRVRLLDFEKNRGKMAALNEAVPELCGEIVAFTDASSMLASDSIRVLAQSFADPKIGAASGVLPPVMKKDQAKLGTQEDLLLEIREPFLKVQEAELGAFTGAGRIFVRHSPRTVSISFRRHNYNG